MILTLKSGVKKSDVEMILKKIKELGFIPHLSKGAEKIVIGVIGEKAIVHRDAFESMDAVEVITPISKPYKLVSREFKKDDSVVRVGNVEIGGGSLVIMAGPCSVDTEKNLMEVARAVKKAGGHILRGGAFKPRTSPYAFQGLGDKALKMLSKAGKVHGLPVVTEVMDPRHVGMVERYADILQIGARNAQNFDLLKEVGKSRKPIFLKRGMATTIEEWLMAAEYVFSEGNHQVILCERGIRTFETSTRFTLDLNAIPVVKRLSHLPIFVDPSHGVGVREFVTPMARAAVAAGADGIMVEVHARPAEALSDAHQALLPAQFAQLIKEVRAVAASLDPKA